MAEAWILVHQTCINGLRKIRQMYLRSLLRFIPERCGVWRSENACVAVIAARQKRFSKVTRKIAPGTWGLVPLGCSLLGQTKRRKRRPSPSWCLVPDSLQPELKAQAAQLVPPLTVASLIGGVQRLHRRFSV